MQNIQNIRKLIAVRNYIRTLPVYLCILCSQQKHLIEMDVARWNKLTNDDGTLFVSVNWYLTEFKEFRNLLQHRLKYPSLSIKSLIHYGICRMLWHPLDSLYLNTRDIGGGFFIQHGFSTVVSAKKSDVIAG